jgi:hypothetical protein
MDEISKKILKECGLIFENDEEINEMLFERDILINQLKYDSIKTDVEELRGYLSSSLLTSLQKDAPKIQKWPLLNLVRQILHVYGYNMKPIRKSDGYTVDGIKKFKRFFLICKKQT